ncbi:MAG: glucose-1-phosphate thymidylyltransferase RfbA [Promethearchaeota archaeon]
MKGIILAGGMGTRLYPITYSISKQLLPVYNKPMIYYPLSALMLTGIQDILIISTVEDMPLYKKLLGNGEKWGIKFSYIEQNSPKGLAHAFILGEEFINNENVALILGDNIFYGQGFQKLLLDASKYNEGARIFGYWVNDPERYGVVEFDEYLRVISIEEKPNMPKTNYAVPGLYFYDKKVCEYAKYLKPSKRGELEISDLNNIYLKEKKLKIKLMGRGMAWFDTGTHDSLLEASEFVATVERRQGLLVSCIEEVAYRMGYIDENKLEKLAKKMSKSVYGKYLMDIIKYDVKGYIKIK